MVLQVKRAVVDEDLPRSFSVALKESGWRVFDIRDHNLRGKPDNKIFKFAQNKKAVLFSADLGFSNILNFPPEKHCGICILRFPTELDNKVVNMQAVELLKKMELKSLKNKLLIISPNRVRVRS